MSPMSELNNASDQEEIMDTTTDTESLSIDDHVLVRYDNKLFPGVVTKIEDNGARISAMEKYAASWKWPQRPEELFYENSDIVQKIKSPIQKSRRGNFDVPEYVNE
ncbi:hypothetical protein NQ314_015020 [Rhamnusium bicolor]|uniref:Uncharacterized protein n=1 Tax=Rhamnusium bicolor TaxID=1586634 RepID=A0AAV8X056_9CUCU|nr:hypothetical protein NQ314_015020 [Rhamnusium bicolor]